MRGFAPTSGQAGLRAKSKPRPRGLTSRIVQRLPEGEVISRAGGESFGITRSAPFIARLRGSRKAIGKSISLICRPLFQRERPQHEKIRVHRGAPNKAQPQPPKCPRRRAKTKRIGGIRRPSAPASHALLSESPCSGERRKHKLCKSQQAILYNIMVVLDFYLYRLKPLVGHAFINIGKYKSLVWHQPSC
jgi:hypothetical protein